MNRLLPLLTASVLAAACAPPTASSGAAPSPQSQGLHVSGIRLVNGSGSPVRLIGVNRSGTEYACIQGWGIFDGPQDEGSIAAMKSWHINAVRVPLNEDCWLGINGVSATYGGNAYRDAIIAYVEFLHHAGLDVILDLHWTAPGSARATMQMPMPDMDHSPAFWTSVAQTFKDDNHIVFDLFNEPFADRAGLSPSAAWSCWASGCTMSPGWGVSTSWQAAGMQALVQAVRSTGATQPLMVGGLRYANDLSGWDASRLDDPLSQLVASFHVYNFNACINVSCWSQQVERVAADVPVVTGEIGENDCAGDFINTYMPWADAHGVSYLAWTWNTWDCRGGPALITDYSGTPTAYGASYRTHLQTLAGGAP
ncbi:MAG: cellulase family glycosylhydrolase [Candidatus Dormibacteraeota bacterium]|nr:cellulase family glycosylhydrolase [Candidatus Dormibacteraeota bacterium]